MYQINKTYKQNTSHIFFSICRAFLVRRGGALPPTPLYEGQGQYVPVYHTTNLYPHSFRIPSPMKMEKTRCSETSTIKHLTPEDNPKHYTRHWDSFISDKIPVKIYLYSNSQIEGKETSVLFNSITFNCWFSHNILLT
jgi:hypothetical protein